MAPTNMLSSDSHIVEPPDLWSSRLDREYRERGPAVRRLDSGDWWFIDGRQTMSFVGFQTGDRFDKDGTELRTSSFFGDVRRGAYDPRAFIDENERDGVVGSVLYPSQGLMCFGIVDSALCSATMRAYNDALADFCSEDRRRLKGVGMVNVDDPLDGIREMTRCRELGLGAVMITVSPPPEKPYDHPMYEPFWSAAEDLAIPVAMHVATGRTALSPDPNQTSILNVAASALCMQDVLFRKSIADIILGGVFERHPNLRMGSVEHEVSWIPYFLWQMDYCYTDRPARAHWHRYKDKDALPSRYWRDHMWVSFQEDPHLTRIIDVVGVETLAWGSDYPHTESTFPQSRAMIDRFLAGVPEAQQRAIVRENTARLFAFDV